MSGVIGNQSGWCCYSTWERHLLKSQSQNYNIMKKSPSLAVQSALLDILIKGNSLVIQSTLAEQSGNYQESQLIRKRLYYWGNKLMQLSQQVQQDNSAFYQTLGYCWKCASCTDYTFNGLTLNPNIERIAV